MNRRTEAAAYRFVRSRKSCCNRLLIFSLVISALDFCFRISLFLIFSSDDIGKCPFHFAEVPNAGHAEEGGDESRNQESRKLKWDLAAEEGPAEAVDDADHRVERVEQMPFFGDDRAAETDRRNVKTELHDEWDDVTEVAVFDVQRTEPEAGA